MLTHSIGSEDGNFSVRDFLPWCKHQVRVYVRLEKYVTFIGSVTTFDLLLLVLLLHSDYDYD
jgi:hypothetical protein